MAENGTVYSIAVTLLVLNIVTPIFTYALTDLSTDQDFSEELEYLDLEDLISAGVYLRSDERYLLTYEGTPDYITFLNTSKALRVRWWDTGDIDHDLEIYTKLYGELNDWWLVAHLERTLIGNDVYQEGLNPDYISNNTIAVNFDSRYNWTRARIPSLGAELFFTCEAYDNNISQAIDAGILNVTAGNSLNYENFTPLNFLGWYWGQLSGADYYDMPAYIAWIFRLQAVLLIFSGVIIARDLIGFT